MSVPAPRRRSKLPRRRDEDRWPLRPGDLPAVHFVDQDEALGTAAENPVYRAMIFGLRSRGGWSRLPPYVRGTVLGLAVFILVGVFSTFWPALLLVSILVRGQKGKPSRFFTIPEGMLTDLLQSPLGPRDWTLAFWARGMRPGGRSAAPTAVFTFLFILLSLTMLLSALLGPAPIEAYAWFAGSAGILAGSLPFLLTASATEALPASARQLRGFRVELLRRRNPLLRLLSLFIRLIGIVVALFLLSGALVGLTIKLSTSGFGTMLGRWAAHPSAPGVAFLAGLMVAAGFGIAWRSRARRRRDVYLRAMDRDMTKILEFLRYAGEPEGRSASLRGAAAPRPRALGGAEDSPEAPLTHAQ